MAARKKEKETVEKENTEQQSGRKKKPFILVFLMVAAAAVAAGGLVMGAIIYFIGIPGVMPKMKATPPPVYETLELGERVVNLTDPGNIRYLRVRIVLEYKKNEKLTAELKEKNAQVMDAVLKSLRSKSVDDIRPLEKEEKVKVEILNSINARLTSGKVERIYFTDFLIQ